MNSFGVAMGLDGINVLIVEDDPVFRQLIGDYCRKQGMNIDEAEDGQVGLERFAANRPDLMLVDLSMPRMGGQEFLAELASLAPEVPSIVITGNKAMSDVVDALRHGAWDYLMKPLTDLHILHNAMTDCLRESGGIEANTSLPEPTLKPTESFTLNDNYDALRNDPHTAQLVQAQLFPAPELHGMRCHFGYSLYKCEPVSDRLCDGFEADNDHFCTYLAHISPESTANAFVSVLIRSFFNQKLKRYRQGGSTAILEPYSMLCYLNEQLVKSGLNCSIEIVYVVLDQRSKRISMARCGSNIKAYLRTDDTLSPLLMADTTALGVGSDIEPSSHFRSLEQDQALALLEGSNQARQDLLNGDFSGVNQALDGGSGLQLRV
ncbi:response regulator [Ferrimonas lipolytica]|uniref:Response regulator n=1 Tax=Ferrimonas lipolytica TaxID=2724191 RepID=A0A6H1UAP4_9GAMM|nr:response regulator [Ferrimonas lipolytica]QIZ75660.1 response regulator [Ferrimonas lipolytica]